MNEVISAIMQRRSIRKFQPKPVPKELLQQITAAGTYAASGRGSQGTLIVAITDKEWRDRLSAENCRIGGWDSSFDPFYGAPAVLLVLADKSRPTCVYDGSLVMDAMMLASHSLGLGSCWIHRAKEEMEGSVGRELLEKLGIDGKYEGIGHCVVGYCEGDLPEAAPRKENRVFYVE